MIHYHGLPITPATAAEKVLNGGHAFISFKSQGQLALALDVAQSFAVDNGAFSDWNAGTPTTDWKPYYQWVEDVRRYPSFDFAVIPDVIGGTEAENDGLVYAWPLARHVGAPVWHMHESLERLVSLATSWPRICLGSSGDFSSVGTTEWWHRMALAMDAVCDETGRPACKLHGLRMLNPAVFTRLPLASADSTNIGRNIGLDSQWRGSYLPVNKDARAQTMRQRIESHQAATCWDAKPLFI